MLDGTKRFGFGRSTEAASEIKILDSAERETRGQFVGQAASERRLLGYGVGNRQRTGVRRRCSMSILLSDRCVRSADCVVGVAAMDRVLLHVVFCLLAFCVRVRSSQESRVPVR